MHEAWLLLPVAAWQGLAEMPLASLCRCGRLVFHISLPYSFLHFPYVESAVHFTYTKDYCGNCIHYSNSTQQEVSRSMPCHALLSCGAVQGTMVLLALTYSPRWRGFSPQLQQVGVYDAAPTAPARTLTGSFQGRVRVCASPPTSDVPFPGERHSRRSGESKPGPRTGEGRGAVHPRARHPPHTPPRS